MKEKDSIFTIMSFDDKYDRVYHQAIKPAVENCGYRCVRADDDPGPANIPANIVREIIKAKYVIADVSKYSPNVFYELGISHCIDNKTIIIKSGNKNLPFDLGGFRIISYAINRNSLRLLLNDLERAIHSLESSGTELPNNLVQDAGRDYFDLRKKILDNLKEISEEKKRARKFNKYLALQNKGEKHDNRLVANKIVSNIIKLLPSNKRPLLVCITGSGAIGKSTFSNLIAECLHSRYKKKYSIQILPTDSYQLSRAERIKRNIIGFDPRSHNLDRLRSDVEKLLNNKKIEVKPYDHTTGKHYPKRTIKSSDILILEGVYSFYPTIAPLCPKLKYYIYANKSQAKELKFIADFTERDYDIQKAFRHSEAEYEAYEFHILPFLKLADNVILVDEYWKYNGPYPPERTMKQLSKK